LVIQNFIDPLYLPYVCVNGRVHRGSSESIVHVVSENCLNKVDIDNSELTHLPLSRTVATQSSLYTHSPM